jgi:hypothetical protein
MLLPTPSSNVLFCDKSTSKGISWQFVRSYRDKAGLPKQRVLASLGLANLPLNELKPMAKAIERALLDRASLFSDEIEPIHLSTTAAYWVDRVYRQIARDDRFRYPQFLFHSKAQNSSFYRNLGDVTIPAHRRGNTQVF